MQRPLPLIYVSFFFLLFGWVRPSVCIIANNLHIITINGIIRLYSDLIRFSYTLLLLLHSKIYSICCAKKNFSYGFHFGIVIKSFADFVAVVSDNNLISNTMQLFYKLFYVDLSTKTLNLRLQLIWRNIWTHTHTQIYNVSIYIIWKCQI